jgi:uncharacterized protein (DUF2147 family)
MKVKNKQTGVVVEATKINETTYSVEGKEVAKTDMATMYEIVKAVKPAVAKPITNKINIVAPTVEIGGDKVAELFDAIAKASGQMKNLNKGKEAFNYKYITLGQVIDMTRKPLADNGLAVMNFPSTYIVEDQVIARVEMIVSHKDGSYISSVFDVPVNENKKQQFVQSVATIQSYCVRYHRVNLLGIAGEDDTDGA